MKPRGSMPHLQGLSNNPYREPNQLIFLYWHISLRSILILSHLRLGLPRGLVPVHLSIKILKVLLLSSILATSADHLRLLDLIPLLHLVNDANY